MTEKEFAKLKRHELLELLLAQGQEQKQLEEQLGDTEKQLRELEVGYERLRARLNEKDDQLGRLKERLDDKDAQIHKLRETLKHEQESKMIQLEEAGSIAEAALQLSGIFEAAQEAADQYLENVRLRFQNVDAEIARREEESRRYCKDIEERTKAACRSLLKSFQEDYSGKRG